MTLITALALNIVFGAAVVYGLLRLLVSGIVAGHRHPVTVETRAAEYDRLAA